jgi:choline dehydrogenase-like flavoprotein
MQMQSRFQVAADWPLSYQQLEPFYVAAENVLGVAGPGADQQRPRSAPLPLPAHALSFASQKVAAGCKKLGLGWQANTLAILSQPYDGRPACNYCGNCARGCPRTDKGTADITFLRQAQATGRCEVLPNTTVTGLATGPNDQITALTYIDAQGATQRASAALFVLAAGAVETPRLLLSSNSGPGSMGLANESGQVGKNFMETLFWSSHGLHPQQLGSHRGVPVDSICWDFNAPDSIPGVVGGARFSITTAEANLNGPLAYATRVVPGWGRKHKEAMRDSFGKVLGVGAIGESLPNARSYIDLDPDAVDNNGTPLARIHSHLPDTELKRLRFMAEKSRHILQASGIDRIFEESSSYDQFSSTHVFGTCRMGHSPEFSVVDSNCRSHRWKNLYITDASVFPSSGGGESPSLTIQALAIRAARHMRASLSRRDISRS